MLILNRKKMRSIIIFFELAFVTAFAHHSIGA